MEELSLIHILDSVDFDGETFQIEKAEPFELELTAKTRHKYTMSGHATLTVRGHLSLIHISSRLRMWALTVGCEMYSFWAASEKL